MQIHTPLAVTTRKPSLLRRLATGWLPGRTIAKARVAASHPLWLSLLRILLAIVALAEIIVYNAMVIEKVSRMAWMTTSGLFDNVPRNRLASVITYEYQELCPHVLPWLFEGHIPLWARLILPLLILALVLLALELLNVLVFAPFSVPFGQKLRTHLAPCRKIVYNLGGLWIVQAAIPWTLVTVFVSPRIAQAMIAAGMERASDGIALFVFGMGLPLALLLAWAFRLMRACSGLTAQDPHQPEPRCGRCGYFLEGLAAKAACPECGLDTPDATDRHRRPSAWARARGLGRFLALARTVLSVTLRPARFFRNLQVLGQTSQSLRFFRWTLWLCIPLAVCLAWPIPLVILHPQGPQGDWIEIMGIVAFLAVMSTLIVVLILGLLMGILGLLIHRARQEAAWPIATAAGAYLAALIPGIWAAQVLWTALFIVLDRHNQLTNLCRALATTLRIDWEFPFLALAVWPLLLGLLLAIRTTVVCYKHVRYACR